jgi:hypothetical protein
MHSVAHLKTIPRTVGKEPTYQFSPRYALLAFGSRATFRVWLAFDGDTLYVDWNGNGDLTEPGKHLKASRWPFDEGPIRVVQYEIDSLHDPGTGTRYTNVVIQQEILKPGFTPQEQGGEGDICPGSKGGGPGHCHAFL